MYARVLIFLIGCATHLMSVSSAGAGDASRDEAKRASWLATAELTVEAWLEGSITQGFASATLRTCSDQLAQIDQRAPPRATASRSVFREAASAVSSGDRQRATAAMRLLEDGAFGTVPDSP